MDGLFFNILGVTMDASITCFGFLCLLAAFQMVSNGIDRNWQAFCSNSTGKFLMEVAYKFMGKSDKILNYMLNTHSMSDDQ